MTDNNEPRQAPEIQQYYKIAEIAKMLSMSKFTVRQWIKDGKLPAIQISNRYRVSHSDLKKFLEEKYG